MKTNSKNEKLSSDEELMLKILSEAKEGLSKEELFRRFDAAKSVEN